ncbi:tetratricopeptide repeat protein [Phenylobacterium parvum]|nr:SEL1-like repeat protein [Phenylobacterium parvum]
MMRRYAFATAVALAAAISVWTVAVQAAPAATSEAAAAWSAYDQGDYVAAAPSLRRLAEAGDGEAQAAMGWMYEKGLGVKADGEAAWSWRRRAAQSGEARAQYAYATNGFSLQMISRAESLKWLRKSAGQGYAPAQFELGKAYARGLGLKRDDAQAVALFSKAAGQGYPRAQVALGQMYESGRTVEPSKAIARDWYLRAGLQGDPEAQARLGDLASRAVSVRAYDRTYDTPDPLEAARWFALSGDRQATDLAMRRMTPDEAASVRAAVRDWRPRPEWTPGRVFNWEEALIVKEAQEVTQTEDPGALSNPTLATIAAAEADLDFARARKLARAGAEAGDPAAQSWLARMDLEGISGPRDLRASRDWMRRASTQGHAASQIELAVQLQQPGIYQPGVPDPEALAESYFWAQIADANPSSSQDQRFFAKRLVSDLSGRLTPDAAADARRRAAAWKAQPEGVRPAPPAA